VELTLPNRPGAAGAAVRDAIRNRVGIAFIERDRSMADDVAAICRAVRGNELLAAAEACSGELSLGQGSGAEA